MGVSKEGREKQKAVLAQYQFKKGQSGNPTGKPSLLKEILNKVLLEEKNGMTGVEAIFRAHLTKAVKGDVASARMILEYKFGKPKELQDEQVSTEPLRIIIEKE